MAKILLVEDDNNLREIYEARLMAEGYTIVSAPDGEAALAVASKEKPDLVISDVMMPNISGFDMLDIMRNTPETANIKVIMLTALSQAEDQARAQALGADRYLVKSQVTLEDIVNNAKVLLGDGPAEEASPAAPTAPVVTAKPVAVTAPPAEPDTAQATQNNDALLADAVNTLEASVPTSQLPAPEPEVAPTAPVTPISTPQPTTPEAPVVEPAPATPINVVTPDEAETKPTTDTNSSESESLAQEEQAIQSQIDSFAGQTTTAAPVVSPEPAAAPVIAPAASASPPAPTDEPAPEATAMPDVTPAPLHDSAGGTKVIEPIDDADNPNARPDINTLLAAEEAKEESLNPAPPLTASTVSPVSNAPKPEDIAL